MPLVAADPNGGLNANPASYGSISINETICGSASTFLCIGCAEDGTDLTYRDTDWYLFDNVDGGSYTITVGGEGPLLFGMVDLNAVAFVANAFSEAEPRRHSPSRCLRATTTACSSLMTSMPHHGSLQHQSGRIHRPTRGEAAPLAAALGDTCVGDFSPPMRARAAPTSPTSRATRATPVRSHATAPVLLRLPSRVPGPPAHRHCWIPACGRYRRYLIHQRSDRLRTGSRSTEQASRHVPKVCFQRACPSGSPWKCRHQVATRLLQHDQHGC